MRITPAFLLVTACGASADKAATPTTPTLTVDVHAAAESNVNAYVVEACVECRWNHLLRVIPVGGRA